MLKWEVGLIIFFHWKGKGGLQENLSPRLKIRFTITSCALQGPIEPCICCALKYFHPSWIAGAGYLGQGRNLEDAHVEKRRRGLLPPLRVPLAWPAKHNNRRMLRRLILNCFHRWYQGRKRAKEVSPFQLYCGWRRMSEAQKLPTFWEEMWRRFVLF